MRDEYSELRWKIEKLVEDANPGNWDNTREVDKIMRKLWKDDANYNVPRPDSYPEGSLAPETDLSRIEKAGNRIKVAKKFCESVFEVITEADTGILILEVMDDLDEVYKKLETIKKKME